MCIIISKRAGSRYDSKELEESLKTAYKWNCHGGGFSVKKAGSNKVVMSKGYIYPEVLKDAIDLFDIQDNDELMVHLRRATVGEVNASNCHPFIISDNDDKIILDELSSNKESVVCHNGTFYQYKDLEDNDFSDTHNFIKKTLCKDGFIKGLRSVKKVNYAMSAEALGTSNRLCIMSPDTDMDFYGYWNRIQKDTFWYSNYYHTQPNNGYNITNQVVYDKKIEDKIEKYNSIEDNTVDVVSENLADFYENNYGY